MICNGFFQYKSKHLKMIWLFQFKFQILIWGNSVWIPSYQYLELNIMIDHIFFHFFIYLSIYQNSMWKLQQYINGLFQDGNSSALAMELLQSCTYQMLYYVTLSIYFSDALHNYFTAIRLMMPFRTSRMKYLSILAKRSFNLIKS